ncbi:MAG: hypothetical protein KAT65_16590 [Methanophagales archaeon]|nr:hypothetical protein [Methanophagales archaeon]
MVKQKFVDIKLSAIASGIMDVLVGVSTQEWILRKKKKIIYRGRTILHLYRGNSL